MKKIILISIALCAVLSVSAFCIFSTVCFGKSLYGSGKIVTRTIDAPQFDEIDASRGVQVVVAEDASGKITIAADDNLIDLVVVKAHKGELKITIDNNYNSIRNTNVTVTVPAPANNLIRSLDASSAARINCTVALSAPEFSISASSAAKICAAVKTTKCKIDASSAAKIKAAIDTQSCDIDASSAAKIELTGSAKSCTADLSSAASLSADSFVVENYQASTSSGASATINCSTKLNASASSGASINYKGEATVVEVSTSSGGRVSRQ